MTTVAIPVSSSPSFPTSSTTTSSARFPDGDVAPARVRLTQEGTIQRKLDGNPLPFNAVEEIDVDESVSPGRRACACRRLCRACTSSTGSPAARGRSRARMLGVPVSAGTGDERRSARRCATWPSSGAPHAMRDPELHWHVIDEAIVEVDPDRRRHRVDRHPLQRGGDVIAAFGHRPRREGKTFEVRSWVVLYSGYRELGGIRIPTQAEVHWTLPTGRSSTSVRRSPSSSFSRASGGAASQPRRRGRGTTARSRSRCRPRATTRRSHA